MEEASSEIPEALKALKAKIDAGKNPEFSVSPTDQVRHNLELLAGAVENARTSKLIKEELFQFDGWLMKLKTATPDDLRLMIPSDPYLSETGDSEPFASYTFRVMPMHGHELWNLFSKQFGIALPDNSSFTDFLQQLDRSQARQGKAAKDIKAHTLLPLTFRTNAPGVAFFTEHHVPHPEAPHKIKGGEYGLFGMGSNTRLLFKRSALPQYQPKPPISK